MNDQRLPNGERLYVIGHGALAHTVSASMIEREARTAAAAGRTLNDACPYPFSSSAGQHFKAIFIHAGGKVGAR